MTTTLYDALAQAKAYWDAKGRSSRLMPIRAQACASFLGTNAARKLKLDDLKPAHATAILAGLHRTKGKGSVPVYYAAFKRAVALAGGDTRGWPKASTAPRKCREPLSEADLDRLAEALRGYSSNYMAKHWTKETLLRQGYTIHRELVANGDIYGWELRHGGWETYDLLELLRGTGLRVEREALNGEALQWDAERKVLKITGKGDHERIIPAERPETVALLGDPGRMAKLRRLSYSGHLKRWQAAVEALKITSLKPTPHAVRHYYATRAYAKSGRNLKLVQELLGHADISTTARYLGVTVEEMRDAVA